MKSLVQSLLPLYEAREARAVVRAVLEDAFHLSYTQQCLSGIDTLTIEQREELRIIMCRLAKGEPLQYVLGSSRFCGLAFRVTPATLIPRPETEWLVDNAAAGCHARILDIGTGSGCIAIAIAKRQPDAEVHACDISADALEVARHNARLNGVSVNFFQADMLDGKMADGCFHTIVSNPPYVCLSEQGEMAPWVLEHEPHAALFVPDDDPLLFYRAIARHGLSMLEKGGRLMLECNARFTSEVAGLLAAMDYREVAVHNDCFDHPRFVTATL